MLEAVDYIAENNHQQKCNKLVIMIHKRNGDKVYTNAMLDMLLRCVKQQQREEVEAIKFPKN